MATLSGSHAIAGAAVAVSSLGSVLAIAMVVGGGGTPPFAVLFGTDWIRIRPRKPSSHAVRLLLFALLLNMYAHGKG